MASHAFVAAASAKQNVSATDSLDDDMVKLVAYTIVSLRRDAEAIMPEGEASVIVTDRMSSDAFIAQVIASYIQARRAEIDQKRQNFEKQLVKRLEKAKGQRRDDIVSSGREQRKKIADESVVLEQSLERERQYLRVYFVVSKRWPREPLRFEERQVDALREIRRAMT